MIQKYLYGVPFDTESVVAPIPASQGEPPVGTVKTSESGFCFACPLAEGDRVYGLGEANRGINKRGFVYVSDNVDDGLHTENKQRMYAAHNFIVISGQQNLGLFFDYPARIQFDIGFTRRDWLEVTCERADLVLYVITGDSACDVVKQFRAIIGRSYIPPKFAFGFGQSRYGYKTQADFEEVVAKHRQAHIPLDMVYMDIDYMDHYKDFTVNPENFPDFSGFVSKMKEQGVRLVPIVDAGVKEEAGYSVCDEGKEKGYFCKRADGTDFEGTVWLSVLKLLHFFSLHIPASFQKKFCQFVRIVSFQCSLWKSDHRSCRSDRLGICLHNYTECLFRLQYLGDIFVRE